LFRRVLKNAVSNAFEVNGGFKVSDLTVEVPLWLRRGDLGSHTEARASDAGRRARPRSHSNLGANSGGIGGGAGLAEDQSDAPPLCRKDTITANTRNLDVTWRYQGSRVLDVSLDVGAIAVQLPASKLPGRPPNWSTQPSPAASPAYGTGPGGPAVNRPNPSAPSSPWPSGGGQSAVPGSASRHDESYRGGAGPGGTHGGLPHGRRQGGGGGNAGGGGGSGGRATKVNHWQPFLRVGGVSVQMLKLFGHGLGPAAPSLLYRSVKKFNVQDVDAQLVVDQLRYFPMAAETMGKGLAEIQAAPGGALLGHLFVRVVSAAKLPRATSDRNMHAELR